MTANVENYIAWLAGKVSDLLNAIDIKHTYDVQPQVGDYQYQPIQGKIRRKQPVIFSGTLISRQNELVPYEGYELFSVTSLLTFIVPKKYIPTVFGAVSKFVSDNNGSTVTYTVAQADLTEKSYDVQFDLYTPTVANLEQRQGAGTSAEIRLFVATTVAAEAVFGNAINLSINYTKDVTVGGNQTTQSFTERLLVLQGAMQTVKTYDADNVSNEEYVRSVPTSQTMTITAKVAYRKTDMLQDIVRNVMKGDLDKVYNVSYSDGAAVPGKMTFDVTIGQATVSFAPGEITALDLVMYRNGEVTETQPATPASTED